jgi:hypothetical protein
METLKNETGILSIELRMFLQMLLGKDYEISPTGIVQAVGDRHVASISGTATNG